MKKQPVEGEREGRHRGKGAGIAVAVKPPQKPRVTGGGKGATGQNYLQDDLCDRPSTAAWALILEQRGLVDR